MTLCFQVSDEEEEEEVSSDISDTENTAAQSSEFSGLGFCFELTHCGLVMPCIVIPLSQHWIIWSHDLN